MRATAGLVALALLAASPALAADPPPNANAPLPTTSQINPNHSLLLIPNRRISVALDDKLEPGAADEGAADLLGFAIPKNDSKIETWFEAKGQAQVDPDKLRFNLYAIDQPAGSRAVRTLLVVANGRPRPVVYFAALIMGVEGRHLLKFTTICSIAAGHAGIESWSDQVEGIVILKVVEIPGPICTDAATGKFYPPGQQPPPPDPPAAKPN